METYKEVKGTIIKPSLLEDRVSGLFGKLPKGVALPVSFGEWASSTPYVAIIRDPGFEEDHIGMKPSLRYGCYINSNRQSVVSFLKSDSFQ